MIINSKNKIILGYYFNSVHKNLYINIYKRDFYRSFGTFYYN